MSASFRDLEVWRKAMDLAADTYRFARPMPKQEEYRLTAQLIRAAISIALGSAAELDTLIELVSRAGFAAVETLRPLADQVEKVSRMLNRLHARLREPPPNPQSLIPNPLVYHDVGPRTRLA